MQRGGDEEVIQTDSMLTNQDQKLPPLDLKEQSKRSMKGLSNLVQRSTPWLFTLGSWIFGGLIAVDLVIVASLITVGPVDIAILISITAFAVALPLNVSGIFLLRLIKDLKDVGIEDVMLQAFKDASFPNIEAYFPPSQTRESLYGRSADIALCYSLGILALSIALTLAGLVAALWYMAWWISLIFVAMAVVCLLLVFVTLAHSVPPESDAEKALKKRYMEQRNQQRKGRAKS